MQSRNVNFKVNPDGTGTFYGNGGELEVCKEWVESRDKTYAQATITLLTPGQKVSDVPGHIFQFVAYKSTDEHTRVMQKNLSTLVTDESLKAFGIRPPIDGEARIFVFSWIKTSQAPMLI